ncbi:uncharacterized protein LOC130672984 [Microplitis mediator]|uniref:uncharacterized protein LOC130672984 n=1 Tax=Microplitis mediator TaxID=375433 RepID=UPI002556D687|nr:uncharacterized protein LOC130672984 [Microplitis mediator]
MTLVNDAMLSILNSCFVINSTNVILSGDIDDTTITNFHHFDSMLSLIIKNSVNNSERFFLFERQPVFIIVAPTFDQLRDSIASLRTCSLWDINQPFFILHKYNCKTAFEFLRQAWRYNLLMSFFICYSKNGHVKILAFNPYSNLAPDNWQPVDYVVPYMKHPWTLYQQKVNQIDDNFCGKLLWNKATKLDGYEVRAIGTRSKNSLLINSDNKSVKNWHGADGEFLKILFMAMNVTVTVTYYPNGSLGYIDKHGNPWGTFVPLAMGEQDVLVNSVFLQRLKNSTIVRLNRISGIKFVTKQKPNMSSLEKLVRFFGLDLFFATLIITIMTFFVLRFAEKQSSAETLLEIVRLLANGALLKPPRWLSVRIYLGPVLFYYLLFQTEMQGLLDSVLTKSIPHENLNTVKDLKLSKDYKLFAPKALIFFLEEEIQRRCIPTKTLYCVDEVINNLTNVCISSESGLIVSTFSHNLHMSREQLYSSFKIYLIRKDWPLQRRFQWYVLAIEEFGFYEFWKQRSMNYSIEKIKNRKIQDNLPAFEIITSDDLAFAFEGLVLGLTCALFSFFIEIKIKKVIILKFR